MAFNLYSITSPLHRERSMPSQEESFILEIENELGERFIHHGEDFSGYASSADNIIYIRTGGTEGKFKSLGITGDVTLLTSGQSNSLAASMEILAFLDRNGRRGRILHGSAAEIALNIKSCRGRCVPVNGYFRPVTPVNLGDAVLGVIGRPSDWLIASDPDYAKAESLFGVRIKDIPMSELLDRMKTFKGDTRSFEGSEAIFDALADIVKEHNLKGLTIRCFDLLDTLHNTGCLALARLNAAGIPSACEGDIPALLSMAVARKKTGCCGFQCNLSRISGDELLFAHCTVPLDMVSGYGYETHFESGLGTAIRGTLKPGNYMIYKISPELDREVAIPVELTGHPHENNLCRTQITVRSKVAAGYLLNSPLANHHIITPVF